MVEKSLWTQKVERDPDHSHWFVQRFRDMASAGRDVVGEARLVDALVERRARILDAGCGSGRTGGELAHRGHVVVGVDVDPVLIDAAREDYPDATWLLGDLAELDLASLGQAEKFDAAVAAGNVMPFLAPSTRRDVLTRIRDVLRPNGRLALGFGAGRGYLFEEFFADAAATGWEVQFRFRGWNLLPFTADSDFLVAVLAPVWTAPGRWRGRRRAPGVSALSGSAGSSGPPGSASGSGTGTLNPM